MFFSLANNGLLFLINQEKKNEEAEDFTAFSLFYGGLSFIFNHEKNEQLESKNVFSGRSKTGVTFLSPRFSSRVFRTLNQHPDLEWSV